MGMAEEDGAFPHQGYLDFLDNQLDPRSGTVRARAVFPNKDRLFVARAVRPRQLPGSADYQAPW